MGIVTDLIYIVLIAFVGGLIAQAFKQPLIIGYIFAGMVVGPHTAGPTVERIHDIEMLAEIGVALLLFTLGLEFSFGELKRLARITFIGTPLQILLCIAIAHYIAIALGFSFSDAMWIGATVSLSSTMVVLKTLASKDALETQSGRIMLAILIAQDLAVIPLMLILPQLAGESINYTLLASAAVKSALFLFGMYLAGTRIVPWFFSHMTRFGSRELFFIATLVVALGAGFISYKLGLSFALGAFVAGMLLSETDFNHQALSDVSSLRDLFGLIFFVSVGMLFDPQFFIDHIGQISLFSLAVIASKALILGGIIRLFGYDNGVAYSVGFGLSQVGEFAFVIANAGSRSGQLSQQSYSLMIAIAVVSMVLTPSLFRLGALLARKTESHAQDIEFKSQKDLHNHVVIIGGGVVGQYVAQVLSALQRPYVVIEADYRTVIQMRDNEISVIFGDGTHRSILKIAGVDKSRLVVITSTNDKILPSILNEVRQLNSQVPIVVRVAEIDDIEQLASHNIHEIVQPQLEAGLEVVRQSLLALGIKEAETFGVLAQLRAEKYEPIKSKRGLIPVDERRLHATKLLEFMWFEIDQASNLVGKSLKDLALRDKFGVSVAVAIRGDGFTPNPGPDYTINCNDIIGILGTESQLVSFRDTVKGAVNLAGS